MAQKKKAKKKAKAPARPRLKATQKGVKAKKKAVWRKPRKTFVKETPAQPTQPVPPVPQENTDLDERQEQIHDAEDATVDKVEERDLGEAK